jgi:two-component system, NarL family, response regulator NreC
VKILVVEDQDLFREMFVLACREGGFRVVGQAGDGETAIELVKTLRPDLVLLDIELPKADGFAVIDAARLVQPNMKFVVLSSICSAFTVYRLERARVQGFIDKNTGAVAMVKAALEQVKNGGTYFSKTFEAARLARWEDYQSFDRTLSARQVEVLRMVGDLMTDQEIAAVLGVTTDMVEKHRRNIAARIGTSSRIEMERWAQEKGFTRSFVRPR